MFSMFPNNHASVAEAECTTLRIVRPQRRDRLRPHSMAAPGH